MNNNLIIIDSIRIKFMKELLMSNPNGGGGVNLPLIFDVTVGIHNGNSYGYVLGGVGECSSDIIQILMTSIDDTASTILLVDYDKVNLPLSVQLKRLDTNYAITVKDNADGADGSSKEEGKAFSTKSSFFTSSDVGKTITIELS